MRKTKNKQLHHFFIFKVLPSLIILFSLIIFSTLTSSKSSAASIIFSDSFEQDTIGLPPSGWVPSGIWSVAQNGTKVVSQTNTNNQIAFELVTGNTTWTDYTFSADVYTVNTTSNVFAIDGRRQSSGTGYELRIWNGNQWNLGRRLNGVYTTLAQGTGLYTANHWYQLSLTFQGPTISAAIDGVQIASVNDTAIQSGQISLRNFAPAQYDNVSVTTPINFPPPSPTPTPIPVVLGSDNFTRSDQSGWNVASDGHIWQRDTTQYPSGTEEIIFNRGYVDTYSSPTDLDNWMGNSSLNQEVSVDFICNAVGFDAFNHGPRLLGRVSDEFHYLYLAINMNNSTLQLWTRSNGTYTQWGSDVPVHLTLDTWYHAKMDIIGSAVEGKVWGFGTTEPAWQIRALQSTLNLPGSGGLRSTYSLLDYDNFLATSL